MIYISKYIRTFYEIFTRERFREVKTKRQRHNNKLHALYYRPDLLQSSVDLDGWLGRWREELLSGLSGQPHRKEAGE